MADDEQTVQNWSDEVNEALATTTQADLARRLGVDAQTVHRWSKGQNARASMLPRLRTLLNRSPGAVEPQTPSIDQWLFDRDELFRRYTLANEIWVIKTGKGLISQEDGGAKATLAQIVVSNLKGALNADLSVKTVNFLVADQTTARHVAKPLELAWEELRNDDPSDALVNLGITKGNTAALRKLQSLAIGTLMPSVPQISYTFDAALAVHESLDEYILKTTDENDEEELKEWVRKTVKIYAFDNVFELWAMGLGFNDTGLIYLSYDAPPSPTVSPLRNEVLWEIDVREASLSPEGMIQSNPRSVWIRPRDRDILSQSKRIGRVIEAIKERGPYDLNGGGKPC